MPTEPSTTNTTLGTRRRTEEPENGASASKRPRLETNQEAQARQSSKKRSKKRKRKGPLATAANRADDGAEEDEEQEDAGAETGPVLAAKIEDDENKGALTVRARSRSQGTNAGARSRPASPPRESPEEIIARLTAQLAAQETLLARKTTTIQSITSSLTCQICLDYLQKPFAMAPCGHIACYSCLKSWFTAGGGGPNYVHKKKTCPHCRAVVRERPVEVWAVKDAAMTLLKAEGAVHIPAVSAVAAPPPPNADAAGNNDPPTALADTPDDADPWKHIFRPVHKPPMHAARPIPDDVDEQDLGMYDAEDSVYRCFDCMHEIWSGQCTHCHRQYDGHQGMDDDDDDEFDDYMPYPRIPFFDFFPPYDDEEDLTDDEGDFDIPNWADLAAADGDEDDEEEDDIPGFGRAESDEEAEEGAAIHRRAPRRPAVIDVSSEGEEDEVVNVPPRRPTRRLYVDSDEEDEDDGGPAVPAEVIEIQDDEDDGESDDGHPLPGRYPHDDADSVDPYAPDEIQTDDDGERFDEDNGDRDSDGANNADDLERRHLYLESHPSDHLDRAGHNYYGQGMYDDDDEYPEYGNGEDEDDEAGIHYPSDDDGYSDDDGW
ncbi:hypothetical protein HDZ31DRAFT_62627 [Schizophyllum fasciatum]